MSIPMQKALKLTDNTENVVSISDFRNNSKPALITGGPTGPENWLKTLNPGWVFLARLKAERASPILNQFMVVEHKTLSTHLIQHTPDGRRSEPWVNTLEFSRLFDLVEVIAEVEFVYHEEKEEVSDGPHEQVQQETPKDP